MVLSVSSSFWCLGRTAVCNCGTPWTFLLPFVFVYSEPSNPRSNGVVDDLLISSNLQISKKQKKKNNKKTKKNKKKKKKKNKKKKKKNTHELSPLSESILTMVINPTPHYVLRHSFGFNIREWKHVCKLGKIITHH